MNSKYTKRRPLLVIFLTVFIDLVGFGIVIPMSPYLAREFGASPLQVGLLMAVYSAMQFLCSPIWGRWSDRLGRRPILLVSIAGTGLAHLLFFYSGTLALLFVARTLAGVFGANISTATAYIADVTESKDRSKSMGLIGVAFGLGFICGPALGGLLTAWGEQTPALAAALLSLINFILAYFILGESLAPENRRDQGGHRSTKRISRILTKIRQPLVGSLLGTHFLFGLGMANMEASLFLYVQDKFSWTMKQASFGFAYVGICIAITQGLIVRRAMPRWGEKNLLILGLLLFILSLLGIAIAPTVAALAVAMTIQAIGHGLINPSLMGSVSLLTPSDEQGETIGVSHSLGALARILGPPVGGLVYAQWAPSAPFFLGAGLAAVGLWVTWRVREKLPEAGRRPS
jgi:DHA1 family tetracycline resistance protein-like MFS transporter